jgi:hypothetical protein
MPRPIPTAYINGARQSFQSLILKLDGQEFVGFKSISLERTRERSMVYGANPDPLGKTHGKNTYKATLEVYVAEFNLFVVQHFGAGYGDKFFTLQLSVVESGFDSIPHFAYGCTIDSSTLDFSEGTDALTAKMELNPVKIVFGGQDDNANPLKGSRAQA